MDAHRVLGVPLLAGSPVEGNIRDYLLTLLADLWTEGEAFSCKRPFGNSGWEYDLYEPLARAGFIEGMTFDEDGYIDEFPDASRKKADELILAAIRSLGG